MDDKENYSNTLTQKNEYNYTGQRIKKHVISLDGAGMSGYTNNYHYDRGNMLYTTDENSSKTTENILNLEGSVISSARLSGNDLSFYSFNKDTRNSTTTLVDENNAGTAVYKYDEFGNTETLGADIGNEVCYTGGINDKETGQLYLNARYYEPEDGRFVTLDTYRGEFEEADTWHLYTYCVNNPINFIDPSGHYAFRKKYKKPGKKWIYQFTTVTSKKFDNYIVNTALAILSAGIGAKFGWLKGTAAGSFAPYAKKWYKARRDLVSKKTMYFQKEVYYHSTSVMSNPKKGYIHYPASSKTPKKGRISGHKYSFRYSKSYNASKINFP